MADRKLRALVVGSGWGRNHALAYQQHPEVELVGICGRTASERSQALARELQVPLYVGLEKALAETQPDLVSCATKEAQHEEVTVAALRAGAHVCCEKMLAHTVASAERMVQTAQETGRELMCSYNYRFSPSALKLRELLDSGALGEPIYATALTFGYCLHHTLDLVCSLLGEVMEVYCIHEAPEEEQRTMRYERYEEFVYSAGRVRSITLKFANGAVGTLISSDWQRVGHPAVRVDLVGTRAWVNMADIVGTVTLYTENREAEVWLPSLILDRLDLPSTTQTAVKAFVEAIRDGKPVPVSGEEGLNRLRVERALLQSAQQGQPVRL
ncbi:MAG TPA: Gfo/Idh/MocA family oxidoreductase [Armatimonadetes bacterium]|nr:Gfo/Idh/MocA family oxidoreductase [Armatimonadota bacterium]